MVMTSTFLPLDFFIVPNHTHVTNCPFYLRPSSFEIKIGNSKQNALVWPLLVSLGQTLTLAEDYLRRDTV